MCWWRWGGRFVLGYLCVTCASGSHPESPKTFLITYFVKMKVDILVGNISWQVQKNNRCDGKLMTKKKKTPTRTIPHIEFETCFQRGKSCQTETSLKPGQCPGSHIFSHILLIFFFQAPGNPAMCMCSLSVSFLCSCSPILSHCLGGGVITR